MEIKNFFFLFLFLLTSTKPLSLDISKTVLFGRVAKQIELNDGQLYSSASSHDGKIILFRVDGMNTLTRLYIQTIAQIPDILEGHATLGNILIATK